MSLLIAVWTSLVGASSMQTDTVDELPSGNYIVDGSGKYIVDGEHTYIVDGS